jgi:hypothetical protein
MTRVSPLLWLALDLLLGLALYETKYAVQRLEEDRVKLDRQVAMDQEQIHVLQAEWSYLRQPERLAQLAARHLNLQPLTLAQQGSFDTLPLRGDGASGGGSGSADIAEVLKAMQVAATPAPAAPPAPSQPRRVE